MKKLLISLFSAFLLSGCVMTLPQVDNQSNNGSEDSSQQETDDSGTETTGDNTGTHSTGDDTGGQSTGDNTGTQTTGGEGGHTSTIDDEDVDSKNDTTQYSLEDYTDFTWHDYGPEYADDWAFYHGTSKNPNGSLWGSVDDTYCGVEFQENCYIVSPTFKPWTKVEIRFYFWYSSHQSSKYNAAQGKSQFIIDCYNSNEQILESKDINITKSDIPNNKTTGMVKVYITNSNMTHFVLKFNNYIANSQGGYSAVLCDATLKGWPQA